MKLYYVAPGWSAVRVTGLEGSSDALDTGMEGLGFYRVGWLRYTIAVMGHRVLKLFGCQRVTKTVTYEECRNGFGF